MSADRTHCVTLSVHCETEPEALHVLETLTRIMAGHALAGRYANISMQTLEDDEEEARSDD